MPAYHRLYVPGGTYFFTVNLADRSRRPLVDHVAALRQSWRDVEQDHAFSTLAAIVLPDHLHVIRTLPPVLVGFRPAASIRPTGREVTGY